VTLASLVVGALVLSGCQSDKSDPISRTAATNGPNVGVSPSPVTPPATVTVAPGNGSTKVRLDKRVTISVAQGTLADVTVTAGSKTLKGELSGDKTSWKSTGKLKPGAQYKVSVSAADAKGTPTTTTSTFKTLTPGSTATASIQPSDGWVVGVGMPVIVNFSRSVSSKKRAAVEKALSVETAKYVEGDWRWFNSQQVQWRPKEYWPANTSVKVTADLAGVELASGVWGSAKRTSDFKIGSSVISTVNVSGHSLTMRRNGKVVRTIPVTTGKASMATRNGIKVIMSRELVHQMRSETIGIKKGDPDFYDIKAEYAMRLTYSGEFLHAAPWSTGSQGRANVSHGCTGMSTANAKWLYNNSKVGDVVIYKNSPRALELGNGYTVWNMSYSAWQGGA
jgi:lipoprotein-anchoring transpeptidase ErfK/SrfK